MCRVAGRRRVGAAAQDRPLNQPPAGFTNLFGGKDLAGWVGRQGTYSPYEQAKLTPDVLAAKKAEWNADRDTHWRVDVAKGEIVSDGQGVHLATEKAFADFELYVDWLMVSPGGDSGIYLRSFPQVQFGIRLTRARQPTARQRGRARSGTTTTTTRASGRS